MDLFSSDLVTSDKVKAVESGSLNKVIQVSSAY